MHIWWQINWVRVSTVNEQFNRQDVILWWTFDALQKDSKHGACSFVSVVLLTSFTIIVMWQHVFALKYYWMPLPWLVISKLACLFVDSWVPFWRWNAVVHHCSSCSSNRINHSEVRVTWVETRFACLTTPRWITNNRFVVRVFLF